MSSSNGSMIVRRCAVGGVVLGALVGAVVGLLIGLHSYAPTAAFAVVELGLPCAVLGGLVGALVGSALAALSVERRSAEPAE